MNQTKGGAARRVEQTSMVRKPSDFPVTLTPSDGFSVPTFNPCFVILASHIQASTKQDLFCERARCQVAEAKQPNSTKLVLVKKWAMKSPMGGAAPVCAIYECPRCGHRTRHHIPAKEGSK